MKHFMLLLAVLTLAACEQPGGSTSQTSAPVADPANDSTVPAIDPNVVVPSPTPSPAPVVVVNPAPTPSPSPSPAPVVTAPVMPSGTLKTSSYGGYTCAIQSDNKVWCSDGTTAVVTTIGAFVDVLVGDGVACALQREQTPFVSGTPQNCAYLSSASCTKPATYYATYCWSGSSSGPVKMQTQNQTNAAVQASGLSTWITGPLALSLDSTSKVCINQGVYDLHSNPQSRHTQTIGVCGNVVQPNGYLQ